jgi:hypothetical protein
MLCDIYYNEDIVSTNEDETAYTKTKLPAATVLNALHHFISQLRRLTYRLSEYELR